jgi:hypothetical protein
MKCQPQKNTLVLPKGFPMKPWGKPNKRGSR